MRSSVLPGVGLTRASPPAVDDGVEPEAGEPAHGGLASLRLAFEGAVAGDAPVVAHRQRRGVGDGHAVAVPLEALEQGGQRHRAARHQSGGALAARQPGELGAQAAAGVVGVDAFELAEADPVEKHEEGHQLCQAQLGPAPPLFGARLEHPPVPGSNSRQKSSVVLNNG